MLRLFFLFSRDVLSLSFSFAMLNFFFFFGLSISIFSIRGLPQPFLLIYTLPSPLFPALLIRADISQFFSFIEKILYLIPKLFPLFNPFQPKIRLRLPLVTFFLFLSLLYPSVFAPTHTHTHTCIILSDRHFSLALCSATTTTTPRIPEKISRNSISPFDILHNSWKLSRRRLFRLSLFLYSYHPLAFLSFFSGFELFLCSLSVCVCMSILHPFSRLYTLVDVRVTKRLSIVLEIVAISSETTMQVRGTKS